MASLYDQFRASYDRQGADYSIIERASGIERDELIEALITEPDIHAVPALGMLKASAAIPVLRGLLTHEAGMMVARAARALWDICEHEEAAPALIRVLTSSLPWTQKLDAAIGLCGIVNEQTTEALRQGCFDDEYLVRYHALNSLAYNLGRPPKDDMRIVEVVGELDRDRIQQFIEGLSWSS